MNAFNSRDFFITKGLVPSLLLGLILGATSNNSYAALAQSPLFLTLSVDPNILFNMSIETPMGGAAYNDQPDGGSCSGRVNDGGTVGVCYFKTKTYLGYFDPNKCYVYTSSRFNPDSAVLNTDHECSGKFSGNFMNWGTMTAMDMFTWTMTGGNRIVDGADTTTVIRRMRKQNNVSWFPHKLVSSSHNVTPSTVTPWSDSQIYIYNTDFGVKFGTSRGGDEKGTMNVDLRVCDNTTTLALESNCIAYDGGTYYKPEGLIQKNADHMRFGVTSFTNTNGNDINGGVLRSNIKYLGTLKPDGSGGTMTNTSNEIAADGTIVLNSNPADATASKVTKSGVIPFINKFSDSAYKRNDPASELFYESIRYFKKLGPTPEYLTGANGGFPILGKKQWEDPITQRCQKNFIIGINDANPWMDKKLPGTFFTSATFNGHAISNNDYGEPSNADSTINVTALTNKVGDLEGLTGTSQPIGCTAISCNSGTLSISNKIIPGLGEVFGTSPYAPKENSYYIAGLAYYANTQDIRTDFAGEQTISTYMIDTQEYGTNPLVGQMNMLWLAGKYGGFNDFNNNDEPDDQVVDASGIVITPSEWDVDGDGIPDNYVFASNPEKLVTALNKAFTDIEKRTSSASAVAANSTQLNTGTQVFQAKFDSTIWSGELQAYSVNAGDGSLTPTWKATDELPAHASRKIYTYDIAAALGSRGVIFQWANLTTLPTVSSQQTYLNTLNGVDDGKGELRVAWLRGDHSNEASASGSFRARDYVLGDIVNSDPLYVGDQDFGYSAFSGSEGSSYRTFLAAKPSIRDMLYIGANDGMFHGFDASSAGGEEIFAYIPNVIFPELSKLSAANYAHQYYVDGPAAFGDVYNGSSWQTILAGTTGAGARGVFALDVTNPNAFNASSALWEFTHAEDADLGYTLTQPSVVKMQDGSWAVVVSNGYNSDNGHAVLFILDALTGAVLQKIDTGQGTTTNKNGLSSPITVDTDGDHLIDTVYAGDLYGNLWKFDVSGSSGSWPVPSNPLFVACSTTGTSCSTTNRQAITAKPNIGAVRGAGFDQNGVGTMVYFGTGKYFETGDNIVGGSPQVQTFYGIWDKDNGAIINDRANLQEQTIIYEGSLTTTTGVSSTHPVRVLTKNTVCYAASTTGCGSSSLKNGWALNLQSPVNGLEGERSISYPLVRRGLVIFSTAIPDIDPCSYGGTSWLMEVDALGGGGFSGAAFDVDGDLDVDNGDFVEIDGVTYSVSGINQEIGISKGPAVIESESVDIKYSSGSTGQMGKVTDAGASNSPGINGAIRRSWLQLR